MVELREGGGEEDEVVGHAQRRFSFRTTFSWAAYLGSDGKTCPNGTTYPDVVKGVFFFPFSCSRGPVSDWVSWIFLLAATLPSGPSQAGFIERTDHA